MPKLPAKVHHTKRSARARKLEPLVAGHGRKPDHLTTTTSVLNEVYRERQAQAKKWGEQNHPDGTGGAINCVARDYAQVLCKAAVDTGTITWRHILVEEAWESFAESDTVALRMELIQTAAVAVAWIEAIDRRAK